jgi:hypothetical protein
VIKSIDEREALIKKLLRFSIFGGNGMMDPTEAGIELRGFGMTACMPFMLSAPAGDPRS